MHIPLDYATVLSQTPDNVEPAYDGMAIEIPLESVR
jgi:phosphoribosyl 1,2-cyclic phosphate phosphodiesterase